MTILAVTRSDPPQHAAFTMALLALGSARDAVIAAREVTRVTPGPAAASMTALADQLEGVAHRHLSHLINQTGHVVAIYDPPSAAWAARLRIEAPNEALLLVRLPGTDGDLVTVATITGDVRDAMLRGDGDAAMRAALAAWLDVDTGNVTDTADA